MNQLCEAPVNQLCDAPVNQLCDAPVNQLCDAPVNEVVFRMDYYENFATDEQDVVEGIRKFLFDKDYNTCDLILSALSNTFETTVNSSRYQEETKRYNEIKLTLG